MSWRGWFAFAALGVIWGLPYFFIKLAVQELSPFVVAWGRIVLAAAILLPIAWHRGALRSLGTHKVAVCTFAMVEFIIPFSTISIGERWIDSSVTGILIAAVPLTITLISRFFGVHDRLGTGRLLGLALGLFGVVALVGFGTISDPLGWVGVACVLLATLGYAIGALIIQRYLSGLDAIGSLAASLLVASIILLPAAIMTPSPARAHGRRALVDCGPRRDLHRAGNASDVLSRQPRGRSTCVCHYVHQPGRSNTPGSVAIARASGNRRLYGIRAYSARLVACNS